MKHPFSSSINPTPELRGDRELVVACRVGDRTAFGEIVTRYQSLVCAVTYNGSGDLSTSEDLAQDTFIAAWRSLAELREPEKLRAWLCGIARTLCANFRRKQKPAESLDAVEPAADAGPTPDEAAALQEEGALIWGALDAIPEIHRLPLILFYRENHSIAAVAAALELSEDAVKQRLSRGRALLREHLAARIETALVRTRPGQAFTLAVLGAVSGTLAASAAAATVPAAGKAVAPAVATAAASAGFWGTIVGVLGGLLGPLIGAWVSHETARFPRQREGLKAHFRLLLLMCVIYLAPFVAVLFGWHPWKLHASAYAVGISVWVMGFVAVVFVFARGWTNRARRIVKEEMVAGTPLLPETPLLRWLGKWEGRRWQSRWTLFGWPLVHVNFGNPRRFFGETWKLEAEPSRVARGWIAFGERAHGLVFAFGNVAVGGIAVGGVAYGLVPLGGLAVGVFPIGGLALGLVPWGGLGVGFAALGGLALGWWALGGGAIAWQAAMGGVAIAHDYAVGGTAIGALHAGDAAAKAFMAEHAFFRVGMAFCQSLAGWMNHVPPPAFLLAVLLVMAGSWFIGFRRRGLDSPAAD